MTLKTQLSFTLLFLLFNLALSLKPPKDFAWGVATAAFQIEGAWNESGKGPSIWDTFSHIPGRIFQNQTADVADDFYHLYPEYIAQMKEMGIKHYRMSISWSRVLPNGTVNLETREGVNQPGVDFYNNLFDALLSAGIEPWVTLYHWDLPDALNDKTDKGGWLNPDVVHRFNDYADFCFQSFGSKVKKWLTLNEILSFTWGGYGGGDQAPGRCSPDRNPWCKEVGGGGNTSTEPYIVAHHAIIAHALAVKTYRDKYQKVQKGVIGIPCNVDYGLPYNPQDQNDIEAAKTYVLFFFGWFYDPIVFGKYPDIMRRLVSGNRLPEFNETMSNLVKGSFDFIGFNHYKTNYIRWTGKEGDNWGNDGQYEVHPSDEPYPDGIRKLCSFIKERYGNHPIYIFENGFGTHEDNLERELNDTARLDFLKGYSESLLKAITEDDVDVRGYFVWSIIDNFEWSSGFSSRLGLVFIDYKDGLKRYIKKSGKWYSEFIKKYDEVVGNKMMRGPPVTELIDE